MKKHLPVLFVLFVFVFSTISAYAGDLENVMQKGTLVFGVSPEYPPFAYKNNDGSIDGLDVAFAKEIAKRIGVNFETVEFQFSSLIHSLELNQTDMIGGAFSTSEVNVDKVKLTRNYYKQSASAVSGSTKQKPTTPTLENFRNMKFGSQKGTSFEEWIMKNLVETNYISSSNLRSFGYFDAEMNALEKNEIDIVIMDTDIFDAIYSGDSKYQIYYPDLLTETYAFGTRKDSNLTEVINQHITDMIKDGTAQKIADIYFKKDYKFLTQNNNQDLVVKLPGIPAAPTAIPVNQIPLANSGTNNSKPAGAPYSIPSAGTAASSTTTGNDGCINSMNFVADVTVPDGSQIRPLDRVRKTWKIVNNGTCTWDSTYSFVQTSGDLNAKPVPIVGVKPGDTAEIHVDFEAPEDKGNYISNWRITDSNGKYFGSGLYLNFSVGGDAVDWSKNVPIAVDYFYTEPKSGNVGACPTVYWEIQGGDYFEIWIDNVFYYRGTEMRGSSSICEPLSKAGDHTMVIWAKNEFTEKSATTKYSATEPSTVENPVELPDKFNDKDIYFAGELPDFMH